MEVLKDLLRLLHPFMPFITEEIWGALPTEGFLMKDCWPAGEGTRYPEEIRKVEMVKNVVKAVRNIRAEVEAAPGKALPLTIVAAGREGEDIAEMSGLIAKLANLSAITAAESREGIPEDAVSAVVSGAELFVPLAELVDIEAELARLAKEKERLEGEVARCEKMLANPGFTGKAPAEKVQAERDKLADYKDMLSKVEERLAQLAKA